jgi:hypothetical protein
VWEGAGMQNRPQSTETAIAGSVLEKVLRSSTRANHSFVLLFLAAYSRTHSSISNSTRATLVANAE